MRNQTPMSARRMTPGATTRDLGVGSMSASIARRYGRGCQTTPVRESVLRRQRRRAGREEPMSATVSKSVSKSSGVAAVATPSPGDHLVVGAEALIVRGKEQGYLPPDDVLTGFPEIEAEPDHLERIFQLFRDMGIEVSDGDRDFEAI